MGGGTQINICDDPWIPSSPNRKIRTRRGNILYTKVSKHIDSETELGDEELRREVF